MSDTTSSCVRPFTIPKPEIKNKNKSETPPSYPGIAPPGGRLTTSHWSHCSSRAPPYNLTVRRRPVLSLQTLPSAGPFHCRRPSPPPMMSSTARPPHHLPRSPPGNSTTVPPPPRKPSAIAMLLLAAAHKSLGCRPQLNRAQFNPPPRSRWSFPESSRSVRHPVLHALVPPWASTT